MLICVAYNPPEASKYHKADITEEISDDILSMSSKLNAYLLIGDLNARTGKLKDFDLEKNMERYGISENTNPRKKRHNCDNYENTQGKKVINLCKSLDLMILNGRTSGNFWENFTHYNNNG